MRSSRLRCRGPLAGSVEYDLHDGGSVGAIKSGQNLAVMSGGGFALTIIPKEIGSRLESLQDLPSLAGISRRYLIVEANGIF